MNIIGPYKYTIIVMVSRPVFMNLYFTNIIKITNVNSMIVIEVKYVAIYFAIYPPIHQPTHLLAINPFLQPSHLPSSASCPITISCLPILGVSLKYQTSAFLSLLLSYLPSCVIKSLFMVKVNYN